MRSLSDQIEALEKTRSAKAAQQEAVMNKSIEEGRSTDLAEAEEIDTLESEIAAVDADLRRLRTIEQRNAQAAKLVVPRDTHTEWRNSQGNGTAYETNGRGHIRMVKQEFGPGIEFSRYVMAIAAGHGNLQTSAAIAANNYGADSDVAAVVKAMSLAGTCSNLAVLERFKAVGAAMTSDQNWAAPLVVAYPRFAGDFIDYLRPRTLLGQITGLRQIPFNVNIAGQSTGATAYWVGEGKPKPLTSFSFTSVNFGWAKIATIAVLSDEMVRFSNPSAETYVRDELVQAIAERMDIDFVNPGKTASAGVSPASITNSVSANHSTGNTATHIRNDIETLLAGFDDSDIALTNPYFIMSSGMARRLAYMRNELGGREFPEMTLTGGSLEGIPVAASRYVATFGTTGGEYVILINAPDVYFADDGQVAVDASREASLEMLDTGLQQDASGGTGASLVSMFQTNSTAIRCERYVNWAKRRTAAVQVLDMCFWGHASASGT